MSQIEVRRVVNHDMRGLSVKTIERVSVSGMSVDEAAWLLDALDVGFMCGTVMVNLNTLREKLRERLTDDKPPSSMHVDPVSVVNAEFDDPMDRIRSENARIQARETL